MPLVRRSRTVPAIPQRLWTLVADPERLPGWWPGVTRVEEVTPRGWTTVLATPKGRPLRADYTLMESDHPRLVRWRQEVEETPFERIMSASVTTLELEAVGEGETDVHLSADIKLRGFSRFGGLQVAFATRKRLDEALDGLEEVVEGWQRP